MKTSFNRMASRRGFGFGVPITITMLLLAALPARADTAYTATGWLTDVPVRPILCTNDAGQVLLRGNAHTVEVQGTDARLTGIRLVFANGGYQADGSALLYGTAYQQVGTFDANANFTPSAGLWEIHYSGVMQTDYSLQLTLVGCGLGGSIDGLRIEETMTRAAASGPTDLAVPYVYTGTIKPVPLNTSVVIDNFNDNKLSGWSKWGPGTVSLIETNQQLLLRGYWPGVNTHSILDSFALGTIERPWIVAEGKTLEWRVDLVSMSEHATATKLWLYSPSSFFCYKGRDYVMLGKLFFGPDTFAVFSYEQVAIRNTNLVVSVALTAARPNVICTVRILDRDNPSLVLYQRTVVDTPHADPTISTAELESVSGMRLNLGSDVPGPPCTSGYGIGLDLFQYNDGHQPMAEAIYDNLELRTSEVPGVGIERTVRLRWPASATVIYGVEGAPTLQGPWMPVQDTALPGMNQMTVPADAMMQVFRLRQAP